MFNQKYDSITILGHRNPDVDSIISGYLMIKLLNSQGSKARFVIPDKEIDEEVLNTCLKYGLDVSKYQSDVPANAHLILVDHYDTDVKGKVIGVIDHHPTMAKFNYELYINKASSSTAMLIYNLNNNVFDTNDIKLVALANLIDTINFKSAKTVETDKEWTIKICQKYNFDYNELLVDGLCLTNLDDINKAIINGEKSYNYNNYNVKSSYIQVDQINNEKIVSLINLLKQKVKDEKLYMWVFLIQNVKAFKSLVYLITNDKTELINYDYLASRGNSVMPNIEKKLLMK